MKTKRFIAAAITVIALTFTAGANTLSFVTNDTQNEKGQTVERMICETNDNILTPYQKIGFKYDETGRIIEKETMKWDSQSNKWMNSELTQYDYSQNPMKVNILKWDNRKHIYK